MENHLHFTRKGVVLAAFLAMATGAGAQALFRPITTADAAKKHLLSRTAAGSTAPQALRLTAKKASSQSSMVLVSEDFGKFSGGTSDNPDTSSPLASEESNIYINSSLTADGTWAGTGVYAAGGSCALISSDGESVAEILTPLGDYSGRITVTCRIKAISTERDGVTVTKGSSLDIVPYKGGYLSGTYAKTDAGDGYSVRIYPKQGWNEVTFTFDNYSADNDGFIAFATQNALVIDDIKITSTAAFLAEPAILPATAFKADGFTINWQPVRKAYDYCIDLYKKVYTTEGDANITESFDNTSIGGDWTLNRTAFTPDGGENGTPALLLNSGDSIASPYNYSKYKAANFFMKVEGPDTLDKYSYGYVYIDVLAEDGWQQVGAFTAGGFLTGRTIDLDQSLQYAFANNYYGFRLRPELSDGCHLILDNFDITTGRAGYLEAVFGDNSSQFGGDDTYYDDSEDCTYTFSNLDPETEYYYRVRSHYQRMFSKSTTHHAFGVSAPEGLTATDITADSYTANWQAAPKATSYTVSDYTVYTATADEKDHVLIEETFDKTVDSAEDIDEMTYLYNYTDTQFDDYADYAGWTGVNNGTLNGMLGCSYNYYYGYLQTPELNTAHADEFTLSIKACGYYGDALLIYTDDDTYTIDFDDQGDSEHGYLDKTITVKTGGKDQRLIILTNAGAPFAIDYFKATQDIKAGDQVLTFNASHDVAAGEETCTFDNLKGDRHAFRVKSHYLLDSDTATSDPSATAYVDLNRGTTAIGEACSSTTPRVTARYSASGSRLQSPVPGINIIKMSDGSVKKALVK